MWEFVWRPYDRPSAVDVPGNPSCQAEQACSPPDIGLEGIGFTITASLRLGGVPGSLERFESCNDYIAGCRRYGVGRARLHHECARLGSPHNYTNSDSHQVDTSVPARTTIQQGSNPAE